MTRARDLGDFIADGGAPELVVDTTTLVVDSTNNRVGVGTASPSAALDVTGDVSIADKIIHTGDTNTAIRFPAADTVTVETGGSERMRIDSSGRVGIGDTSFGDGREMLRVKHDGTTANGTFLTIMSPSAGGVSSLFFGDDDFNEGRVRYDHNSNTMEFYTDDTERLRIDSSGKLLIGNSTSQTTDLLQVESPASGGGHGIAIRRNDNNTSQQLGRIMFGNVVDSDIGQIHVITDGATNTGAIVFSTAYSGTTAERFRFGSQGELGIGGATYGTSGQVLTSGGSGAAPTWADAASGGTAFSAF